jgi:hypothetical protein
VVALREYQSTLRRCGVLAVFVCAIGPTAALAQTDLQLWGNVTLDWEESRRCFDASLTSLEAAKRIDYGPYGEWRAPARLYMNVERAYREFRAEPADAPWNQLATFDAIYRVAKARDGHVEF